VREMTAAVSRTLSLAVRANEIRRQGPKPDVSHDETAEVRAPGSPATPAAAAATS
jgi:hypothetical protein